MKDGIIKDCVFFSDTFVSLGENGSHSAEDAVAQSFETRHQMIGMRSSGRVFDEPLADFFVTVVHSDAAQSVRQRSRHFGRRVGQSESDVLHQGSHFAFVDESRHSFRHVIDKAQRIAQEIGRAQDPGCLRFQFVLINA